MQHTKETNTKKSIYIPSLDGWRALAIIIVFASHIGLGHIVPGGLGVTIFFFLSGYLITTLLIQEVDTTNSVSLSNFYIRRALRLMPPLVLTLVIAYALTFLEVTKGGVSLIGLTSQLLYFANYYYLFFDAGNSTPAGTGIFWSLAVEEHFYIFFPLLFSTLYFKDKARKIISILIITCICTLLWRHVLFVILESSAKRIYYATDTRIDSIIYGCLLALIKNPVKDPSRNSSSLSFKDWLLIFSAITALLLTLAVRNPAFRETVRYSIQGLALAPLFYYSISRPENWIFTLLNTDISKRIGKYSYSIYLIHYFIIENTIYASNSKLINISMILGATMLFATIVDNFLDKPLLKIRKKFQ